MTAPASNLVWPVVLDSTSPRYDMYSEAWNEEPSFRILKEIEAKFPDGHGSVEVIGLDLRLRMTRLREMERLGLDDRQRVIEFPFTSRQWESESSWSRGYIRRIALYPVFSMLWFICGMGSFLDPSGSPSVLCFQNASYHARTCFGQLQTRNQGLRLHTGERGG